MFHEKYYFYDTPLLCNESCGFCLSGTKRIQEYYPISKTKIVRDLLTIQKIGFNNVVIAGGEPTIIKNFIDFFRVAKKMGMKIIVISNGQRLSDKGYFQSLHDIGSLEGVIFSLHHNQENKHDEYVGLAGAYKKLNIAITNSLEIGVRDTSINIALIRDNQKSLLDIITFVRKNYEDIAINICNFEVSEEKLQEDPIKQTMTTSLICLREEIGRVISSGIETERITFQNLPLCTFPKEYITLSRENTGKVDYLEENHIMYSTGKIEQYDFRVKYQACSNCGLKDRCMGVFSYFKEEELLPFQKI